MKHLYHKVEMGSKVWLVPEHLVCQPLLDAEYKIKHTGPEIELTDEEHFAMFQVQNNPQLWSL